ncbi:MAG TPA: ribonuclease P protein component, partial [Thermoanaerobaculia bacterium]|nr:ribonuclease P protein component [Thermoanaerobaculia bacterium]
AELGGSARRPRPVPPAAGERWRSEHRLLRREDFLRCYRGGRRYDGRGVALYVARGPGGGPRFGITASRKVGKSVVRQRVRRRVREIVRRWPQRNRLEALDVVIHLKNDAAGLVFEELRRELEALLERARRGGAHRGSRR